MTEEEFIREAKRRGKSREETLAKFKQLKAAGAFDTAAPAANEEPRMSGLEKATAAATNFASGVTLGLGDEIGAASQAVFAGPSSWSELGEFYDASLAERRAAEEQLAEENPALAIGSELAGSIASPVNLIPGGQATGLARAGRMAGRGAAEGAVYGFNEGEGDGRLSNAVRAGVTGGAVGGALGGATSTLAKRRVARDLGRGEDFVPLHMADSDGVVGRMYRNYIGAALGGRGALRRQETQAVRNNPRLQRFLDADATGSARQARDEALETVDDRLRLATAELRENADDIAAQRAAVPDNTAVRNRVKDETISLRNEVDGQLTAARASADAAEDAIDIGLRREQALAALPDMDDPVLDTLREKAANMASDADIDDFTQALDNYWTNNAFQKVKDAQLVPDKSLLNALRKTMGDDYAAYADVLEEAVEEGRPISGAFLMEIRNNPARASSTARPYKAGDLRQLVNTMDRQLERLLKAQGNTPALQELRRQKAAYGDKVDFLNAVRSRMNKGDIRPAFDETQLGKADKGKSSLRGERPSLVRARAARDAKAEVRDDLAAQTSRLSNRKRRLGQREKAKTRREIASAGEERERLTRASAALKNRDRRLKQRARASAGECAKR